ncbi:MAG: serine/threonine-protein kinase [Pirellulales bacterium]|nr:serine/threonine-protein kinase [Pirellulales bacterium]
MSALTAESLVQRAIDYDLLDERGTRIIWSDVGGREVELDEIKQILLRHDLLTTHQLDRLIRGERHGYFYGKYKVLYPVGQGTFARVYRAVHVETGQIVAIKVLRNRFSHEESKIQQFEQEAEVGMLLKHPNIVGIYEVANEHGHYYMVLEFVEGRNLREFIRVRGQLDQLEATRLAIDITKGLDAASRKGLSHRDLKASNVLVSSHGMAKLVDFGLAGVDPDLSEEAIAELDNPRTIDYAALEKYSNAKKDDPRSDIYFLGCIYYHMLAGTPPLIETKDRLLRMSRNRFLDVKPIQEVVPKVSRGVATVLAKAMAFNPDQRYQTAHDLLGDLLVLYQKLQANPTGDVEPALDPGALHQVFQKQRSLMIIESNTGHQDVFRELFKKNGFRVLMSSDPNRPANTFNEHERPADCVIYSTSELGLRALEAFNAFGEGEHTRHIPAILMLGAKHGVLAERAVLNENRAVVSSPVKMGEFKTLVEKLVTQEQAVG